MNRIDGQLDWAFTLQWLHASAALICLALLGVVLWDIWRELK